MVLYLFTINILLRRRYCAILYCHCLFTIYIIIVIACHCLLFAATGIAEDIVRLCLLLLLVFIRRDGHFQPPSTLYAIIIHTYIAPPREETHYIPFIRHAILLYNAICRHDMPPYHYVTTLFAAVYQVAVATLLLAIIASAIVFMLHAISEYCHLSFTAALHTTFHISQYGCLFHYFLLLLLFHYYIIYHYYYHYNRLAGLLIISHHILVFHLRIYMNAH